jgi:dihydrofolate reductase
MELTVTAFVTLDGVMQSPGGAQEDPSGGFTHGGWVAPYFDEAGGTRISEWFGRATQLLLGRFTYETFKSYWPQVTDPSNVIAHAINTLPKNVVTRRGTDLDWTGARLVTGDVVDAVRALKVGSAEGELQVHGSAGLVQTLLAARDWSTRCVSARSPSSRARASGCSVTGSRPGRGSSPTARRRARASSSPCTGRTDRCAAPGSTSTTAPR